MSEQDNSFKRAHSTALDYAAIEGWHKTEYEGPMTFAELEVGQWFMFLDEQGNPRPDIYEHGACLVKFVYEPTDSSGETVNYSMDDHHDDSALDAHWCPEDSPVWGLPVVCDWMLDFLVAP